MKFIFSLFFVLLYTSVNGQDVHFSQLSKTPLLQSPAMAGAFSSDLRISAHYKNQWANIGNPFTTYAFAIDGKIKGESWQNKYIGIGGSLLSDKAGSLNFKRFQGDLHTAYHQKVNANHYLSFGIKLGVVQHSVSLTNAQWDNQYDGTGYNSSMSSGESVSFQPFMAFDAGAGALWTYQMNSGTVSSYDAKFIQIGLAVHHLNKPNQSFVGPQQSRYYQRYVLHGRGSFGLNNSSWAVEPSFLYQRKSKEQELVIGTMFKYLIKEKSHYTEYVAKFDVSLGCYYRFLSDAVIPTVYFNYANCGLGIGYDINVSPLSSATNYRGGLEISLKFVSPHPFHKTAHSFPSF
ncbi:MAG: type IX secretion system PorP/SprF family membrane protein [Crocinitomix sp.]|jgi:type IX secretion system PorP/SprF family membrane protein